MRFIVLKSDDFEMFHQDIDANEYEFYYRHKETFRRMYKEQGKEFWVRFMLSFRSAQNQQCYELLRALKEKTKCISNYFDNFYINIHEEFIDGPFSRAKQLFEDIVKVVEDRGYLTILHLRSLAKNPFYRKDTKDIYRRFFGTPFDLSSYVKVLILLPMYRRLAGSLCICLRRWLDACEMTDPADKSYWVPPPPVSTDKVMEPSEVKKHRVEIMKLTITKDNTTDHSVVGKEGGPVCNGKREKAPKDVDKDPDSVSSKGNFVAHDIPMNEEMVEYLASLFHLSNSYLGLNVMLPHMEGFDERFPQKPGKSEPELQSNGCGEGMPAKRTAEMLGASSAVGTGEKEMVQRLRDVSDSGDFDSFGIRMRHRLADPGKSKIELKISAAKKEPGMKQTEDVQNGGTVEIKIQDTNGLNAKVSKKSEVGKEPNEKTKSKAAHSKAGKETSVEKEFKAAEDSDSRRKANDTKESDVRQKLEATEESDSGKKAMTTKDSVAKLESKAADENDSREKTKPNKKSVSKKKAKVREESDYRVKEKSSAEQELKPNKEYCSEKEAKVMVDEALVKEMDNQEEKESSRPGSKNVRTCMTCGLQEPAPKVFKKCKRCKDEGCPDPPYYCGRDCQVLDWTGRHRQEHENSCTRDPTTS